MIDGARDPRCHSINLGSVRWITGDHIPSLGGFDFGKTLSQTVELADNIRGVDNPTSGPEKSSTALVESNANTNKDQERERKPCEDFLFNREGAQHGNYLIFIVNRKILTDIIIFAILLVIRQPNYARPAEGIGG
jgi:hypothetical protein